ncbi:hypothetical protein GCM10010919_26150 [Alishewanella longhuensis]|uniref:DUF1109 domain-containing protein n=1 Tax=Alishewanella longhuensis TaxID=1091037 RepID=A0ABQ3L1E0_9ALTE|nr:NrsF family protein [Alishewanella longhuensis]GHG73398.1 hypothetical protein GCM10010919_26150 [Alishewanella longhuensis]
MSDNTDFLIEKLVASHRAVTPLKVKPLLLLALLMIAGCALIILMPLGLRADWHAAALLKSAALLTLTMASLKLTLVVSRPEQPSWQNSWSLFLLLLCAGVLFIAFTALGMELSIEEAMQVGSFWACVSWVGGVGVVAVLILQRLLRRARPGQRSSLRLAVPLCAALLAATVYSLHCPVDALVYLATAYLLAASIVVAFGWLLSRRLWRW